MSACGSGPPPSSFAAPSAPSDWQRCEADGWAVAYPAGWSAHPADRAKGIDACTLFAAEAFQAEPETDWGWTGAQVVLGLEQGCRGSFEVVTAEEDVDVDGRAGTRRTLKDGQDGAGPAAYEYFVDLTPDQPCELGRWFYARTESDDPGDFAENRAILDRMIWSLALSTDD